MADDIINIDPQFLEEVDLKDFAKYGQAPYRSLLNDHYRILENIFNPDNPTNLSLEDWATQYVVETALDEYGYPIFITKMGNKIALKKIGPDKYVLINVNDPTHKQIVSSTLTESMSQDISKLIYNSPKVNNTRNIIPLYSNPNRTISFATSFGSKLSKPITYSLPPTQSQPSKTTTQKPKTTTQKPKKVQVIQQADPPTQEALTPIIESNSRNPIWDVMNRYVPIDPAIQLSNNNPYSYVRPQFWEVDIKQPNIPIQITTQAIPPQEAILDVRTAPVQYPTFDYNDDLQLGTVISTMPDPELKIIPMVQKSEEVVIPKPQAVRLAPDQTQYITPGVLDNFDLFMKSALGDSEYQDLKKNKKQEYKEMRTRFKEEQKILDDRANVNRYFQMREEQFKKLKNG